MGFPLLPVEILSLSGDRSAEMNRREFLLRRLRSQRAEEGGLAEIRGSRKNPSSSLEKKGIESFGKPVWKVGEKRSR